MILKKNSNLLHVLPGGKKYNTSYTVYAENNLRFFTGCINFHGDLAGVHYTEILDMSCMNKAIYYTFVNYLII